MFKTLTSVQSIMPYPDRLDTVLSVLAAGCLFVSMLPKFYTPRRLALYAVMGILALLSAWKTGTFTMLLTVLTCLACYREDMEKTVRFLLFWQSVYVLFLFAASLLLTCLGEPTLTNVSGEMRYNFGFSHPNVFSVVLMNLLCMWVWLHDGRLKWQQLAVVLGIPVVFFFFTGTRSSLLAAAILAALLALRRCKGVLRLGTAVVIPTVTLTEYGLWRSFSSGNVLSRLADELLSSRIKFGAYAVEHFGLSFLGQDLQNIHVQWDELWQINSFTFDDVYSFLAVNQGWLWLVILAALYLRAGRKGSERNQIFLILSALYGVAETHVVNPFLFFPVLLIGEEKYE